MTRVLHEARTFWIIVAVVLLGLALASMSQGRPNINYLVGVLLVIAIYALFALGLSLEFGHTGLLNFGHAATMAIGAYTTAILVPLFIGRGVAESFEGAGAGGVLATLGLAALAFLVLLLPFQKLLSRFALRAAPPRVRRWLPHAVAAAAALLLVVPAYPFGPEGAVAITVIAAVLVGMLLAGLWGLLLGFPAVRLREDYLAIVTIGAAEILKSITMNEQWLTGGTLGIQSIERPFAAWARRTEWWERLADVISVQPTTLVHAVVGLLAVGWTYLFLETLARSPWGRVLKAIREDPDAAAALGKNVRSYQLQVLVLGSAFGALAGVLLAWNLSNVYPEHFPTIVTFYAFIIVIIGGVGNHRGAIVGAVVLWGVFELAASITFLSEVGLRNLAGPPQGIAIGLLLILVIMFRPQGALGRKQEMLYVK